MIRLLYRIQRGEIIDQLESPYFGLLAQGFALKITRFSPLSERFGTAAQRDVGTGLQQLLADRSFPPCSSALPGHSSVVFSGP